MFKSDNASASCCWVIGWRCCFQATPTSSSSSPAASYEVPSRLWFDITADRQIRREDSCDVFAQPLQPSVNPTGREGRPPFPNRPHLFTFLPPPPHQKPHPVPSARRRFTYCKTSPIVSIWKATSEALRGVCSTYWHTNKSITMCTIS